jgi:hypothetical protein
MSKQLDLDYLTPTEDLVLDVLLARLRTGENYWTFNSKLLPTLKKLEARNLIWYKAAGVENAYSVWMEDAAKKHYLGNSTYVSPIEKELKEAKEEVEVLKRVFKKM